MINATVMDSIVNRRENRIEPRRPEPASGFAQMLDGKSRGLDNRREETGRTAEDPIKGEGRREWAHQRSRIDMESKNRNLEKRRQTEGDDTTQEQVEATENPMMPWFTELSATLDQLIAVMDEEFPELPLEILQELELLIQSLNSHQPLMDQMSLVTEQLDQLIESLEEAFDSISESQPYQNVALLIEGLKRLMDESTSIVQREQFSTEKELTETSGETIAQTVKMPQDVDAKTISSEQSLSNSHNTETISVAATDLKDHPDSSDAQPDQKDFASTEKMMVEAVDNKVSEEVIPFNLQQIESLLNQNPLIQELAQQKESLQQSVIQQVFDKIQIVHGSNQSFVTMQLVPEHLGKLTIQLSTDLQQGMTARIYAETAHAKEMIESNFGQLKDALSGKGVNLTSMEVFVGQDPESSEKQREFHYQQARAQRRRGSKITNVNSVDKAAIMSEIPIARNPYVIEDGFDQLG